MNNAQSCQHDSDCLSPLTPPTPTQCFSPPSGAPGICVSPCATDDDCSAFSQNQAQQCIASICRTPYTPEVKVTYAWTNVRSYVEATSIGVQLYGDLALTEVTDPNTAKEATCSFNYHVSILVPRVPCGNVNDSTQKEASLCDPNADGPDNPSGSGIQQGIIPSCENTSAAIRRIPIGSVCLQHWRRTRSASSSSSLRRLRRRNRKMKARYNLLLLSAIAVCGVWACSFGPPVYNGPLPPPAPSDDSGAAADDAGGGDGGGGDDGGGGGDDARGGDDGSGGDDGGGDATTSDDGGADAGGETDSGSISDAKTG